ncbi:MAG: LNS2 domain-containing protein [Planctomycetota bacterium]
MFTLPIRRPHSALRQAIALACSAIFPVLSGCASPYLLTAEDVVRPVDEKARLVGKLEYRGVAVFHEGIEDRELRFFIDGRSAGRDDTNDEGYARLKHRFESPGHHKLEVRYTDRRGHTQTATAAVFVWDQATPILVVDIDQTLSRTKKRYLLGDGADRSQPLPGAATVLNELARRFRVVYLTARPRELAVKTRRWLADQGFPPGPVLTWDVDEYEWSATEYKKDRLDELTDDFDHITIGIGNAESDHVAYRKRKLLTILIDPHGAPTAIAGGVRLPDWSAVRRLFTANPHLYDADLSYKTSLSLPPSP